MSEPWIQLARFSKAALNAQPHDLDPTYLIDFALEHAFKDGASGPSIRERVAERLIDAFGLEGLAWLHPPAVRTQPPAVDSDRIGAHVLAALLVSCGVGFDEAKDEVARQKALPPHERRVAIGRKPRIIKRIPEDVEEAKRMAQSFADKRPWFRATFPYAYWMLFFYSREWLVNYYREGGRRTLAKFDPPPSIKEDRATLVGAVHRTPKDARARAYVRDRAWLEALRSQRERQSPFDEYRKTLVERLKSERARHMAATERPTKWTIKEAARRLNSSNRVLATQASIYPEIGKLVPESSEEFHARLLRWGHDTLVEDGIAPVDSKVLQLTSLHQLPVEKMRAMLEVIRRGNEASDGSS